MAVKRGTVTCASPELCQVTQTILFFNPPPPSPLQFVFYSFNTHLACSLPPPPTPPHIVLNWSAPPPVLCRGFFVGCCQSAAPSHPHLELFLVPSIHPSPPPPPSLCQTLVGCRHGGQGPLCWEFKAVRSGGQIIALAFLPAARNHVFQISLHCRVTWKRPVKCKIWNP